jgi:hypothetical protein
MDASASGTSPRLGPYAEVQGRTADGQGGSGSTPVGIALEPCLHRVIPAVVCLQPGRGAEAHCLPYRTLAGTPL